jgi:Spy/CpxP family protein refolding chaperone
MQNPARRHQSAELLRKNGVYILGRKRKNVKGRKEIHLMRKATLFLAAALLVTTAYAQQGQPGRFQGRAAASTDAIKTYLKLSDQQVTDLKALQTAMRDELKPLVQQLADKTRTLRDELRKDPVDTATVSALRKDIDTLKSQISTKRDDYGVKARKVLSGDQLKALDALQQALALLPAAHQAVGLNLIEVPEDLRGLIGGGGRMGAGVGYGRGAGAGMGAGSGRPMVGRRPGV